MPIESVIASVGGGDRGVDGGPLVLLICTNMEFFLADILITDNGIEISADTESQSE